MLRQTHLALIYQQSHTDQRHSRCLCCCAEGFRKHEWKEILQYYETHSLLIKNALPQTKGSRLVELDQTGTGADESLADCLEKPHMSVFNCQTDQNNSSIISIYTVTWVGAITRWQCVLDIKTERLVHVGRGRERLIMWVLSSQRAPSEHQSSYCNSREQELLQNQPSKYLLDTDWEM